MILNTLAAGAFASTTRSRFGPFSMWLAYARMRPVSASIMTTAASGR